MAKKNSGSRKPMESDGPEMEQESGLSEPQETLATSAQADETPPSKSKAKSTEDPASGGSVGIGDIRKAVAFSNSVGGLDKAIGLLQILKVAKEVQ